jgi:hypothetical protein
MAITTINIVLKSNNGIASLTRFLNKIIIPSITRTIIRYQGIVSKSANDCRKFLICHGNGPNNTYTKDFIYPNGVLSATKEELSPTVNELTAGVPTAGVPTAGVTA